jgi:hypothetical protein
VVLLKNRTSIVTTHLSFYLRSLCQAAGIR